MRVKTIELLVGLFVLLGVSAIVMLGLKVSNLGQAGNGDYYELYAKFNDVGGLKVRSAVKVGGLVVGRVSEIKLDPSNFAPIVTLSISEQFDNFPVNSGALIATAGLLGEQFVALDMGDSKETLKPHSFIQNTQSALVLEDLISHFLNVGGSVNPGDTYPLKATFTNLGSLKQGAPVKVGGVIVGNVSNIELDEKRMQPLVTMAISKQYNQLPTETSASINTSGLIGEQYIALQLGGDDEVLLPNDYILDTQSALVLEELIAQFLFGRDSK